MKKIAALIVLTIMVLVAVSDNLPVKDWLLKEGQALVLRNADVLPLARAGEYLFDKHCATCHDNPAMKAPTRSALSSQSKESLMMVMEFGKMQPMAAHLNKQTRGLIAYYLAGNSTDLYQWIEAASCQTVAEDDSQEYVSNWGLGVENRRFVDSDLTTITPENVGTLSLAWSFAFPKVTDMRSQPAIIGDTLYVGDKAGKLFALDRKTGCVRAHSKVMSGIRSAITVATLNDGRQLLVFADSLATVFAVDPATLENVWQRPAAVSNFSVITGSISYHNNRLYVPVSSYEVAAAGSPTHVCCKSHGAVLAFDASNGDSLWEWHATEDAMPQGINKDGAELFGPSGASVWTSPAIDVKRNRIYFGTGENLTHPATDTSDAIIALDMDSGELVWKFQATANDVWNAACLNGGANCPDNAGEDFDFGASVIMADLADGSQLLLAGQKSGEVFALNPDPVSTQGEVIWRRRISQGTSNGGIHWGMALADQTLFVPVSDPERDTVGYSPRPGLSALDVSSGDIVWQQAALRGCDFDYAHKPLIGLENDRAPAAADPNKQFECSYYYGLSAAATATPQLVFSAGLDGVVRAYDQETGDILWQAKTAVEFDTTNGVVGHGGAIDVAGQTLAGDWLYVLSGYSMFGQLPGNVLLAYKIEPMP
ncbi:MAG: PQQ-binding-like beta-propeller repeat protein [Pseudomonadales bacterium]